MRVLHLISGGDTGGAKTHVFTLLKALNKSIDAELVCLSDGIFYREAAEEGILVTLFAQQSRFDVSVVDRLVKKLHDEGFDILHCHGARANFIGNLVKKKMNIVMATTIHSDFRHDFAHSLYKKLIFTYLNRRSLKKVDYYMCVSNVMKQVMLDEGFDANKMFTIYNGIETDVKVKEYKELTSDNIITFGCATRLMPIKGTDVLLKAVKVLVERNIKCKVLIAGNGEERYSESLFQYVRDNKLEGYVKFLGFVKDMEGFYDTIDINILPSYTEGFPYALLEGGTRGIATIASDAGGIIEMIEPDESGLLFPTGDYKQLAYLMSEVINNKHEIKPLGQGFRQRVVEKFSDQAMADAHIKCYEKMLDIK